MRADKFAWKEGDLEVLYRPGEGTKKTKAWFQGWPVLKGGPTSGNFAHRGLPKTHGGSRPGGGHGALGVPAGAPEKDRIGAVGARRWSQIRKRYSKAQNWTAQPLKEVEETGAALFSEWRGRLRFMEEGALRDYTGAAYGKVNRTLRGKAMNDQDRKVARDRVPDLTSALDKSELPSDFVLYRYTGATLGNQMRQDPIGTVYRDPAFMSTSTKRDRILGKGEPSPYNVQLYVPKGTKGGFLDEVLSPSFHDEVEMLLQRGLKFRLVHRDADNLYVEVLAPSSQEVAPWP